MSIFYGIGINTFRILTISLIFSALLFSQEQFIPADIHAVGDRSWRRMGVMIRLAVGEDANIEG
ncbi:MAG: hypothetical protein L6422_03850 [Candidatus Marinimicrobia bacterium]|nr:hypothetical protein [bacterium]MCG2715411.1 hypothetical protein [Candidatus Neomarinimicrobiota bacterium]